MDDLTSGRIWLVLIGSVLLQLVIPGQLLTGALLARRYATRSAAFLLLAGAVVGLLAAIPVAGRPLWGRLVTLEIVGIATLVTSVVSMAGGILFAIGFIP